MSLIVSGTARADAAGDKVLAAMDAAMNRAKTLTFEYEGTNQEPGKAERKLGMRVQCKGSKRLSEFLAPADMKGTRALIISPTQMYVYLPAFKKVRRIASHTSDQGFLGLAYSLDDMATASYSGSYTAQIASETPTQWKLIATPKAGLTPTYSKITFMVNKDRTLPSELQYFNAAGTNIKTETRSQYTCEGNVCSPTELKMVDNTGGNWTRLVRKSWKVNEAIADDVFSTRNLGE
ncbi:outer membrane lipoprotein-sorting protein [Archangium lansingense]|uniref:Outer membrane lipoprotein-sorting protein n=1 Tax=Archangium lansingense TaxID=2995310 RepID=A0ABT4A707_9BACT|nr:outer membrane lipoprotein-sorting protein [Archangium lansinium]MCY1077029.1 outer membrane lipoprotein-sorting protein [Archangium lansinium]